MVKRIGLTRSCQSSWFYDLGSWHGVARAKSFEEFAGQFIDRGYSQTNFAVTVKDQSQEREWLEKLGFVGVPMTGYRGKDHYMGHVASGSEIEKAIRPLKEERRKKLEEQKQKQREEAAKKAAEELEKTMKLVENTPRGQGRIDFNGRSVTAGDVRRILNARNMREAYDARTWTYVFPIESIAVLNHYFNIELKADCLRQAANFAKMIRYRLS